MADIHQPHDRLFRAVFADPKEAAGLLQANLPPDIRDSFDWTTLALRSGTFIDEELRESQSDLLFQVDQTASGQPVSMYVLLEHQSSPDHWIRLRLLRYLCRIWEAELRDDPERRELRPIVPVVFYQGRTPLDPLDGICRPVSRSRTWLALDPEVQPRVTGPDDPGPFGCKRRGQRTHHAVAVDGAGQPRPRDSAGLGCTLDPGIKRGRRRHRRTPPLHRVPGRNPGRGTHQQFQQSVQAPRPEPGGGHHELRRTTSGRRPSRRPGRRPGRR